jgi:signal transduction histidine kinase
MKVHPSTGVGIDQTFAQGVGDQLGCVAASGFAHHAGAMAVDRLDADAESFADFPVGPSGDDLAEDLPLAIGERFDITAFGEHSCKAAAHDATAFKNAGNGPRNLADIVCFAEHTVRADLYQLGDFSAGLDAGEDHHAGFGRPTARLQQHLGPTGMGHGHIQHEQVGTVLSDRHNRIDPVCDALDNLDLLSLQTVFIRERSRDRVADDRVVVGNHRRAGFSKVRHMHQADGSPKLFAFSKRYSIQKPMGVNRVLAGAGRALALALAFIGALIALPASAGEAPPVAVEPGRSHEMVEQSARYLVTDADAEIGIGRAIEVFDQGGFETELKAENKGEFHDWRVWIALPFRSAASPETGEMRRVIGIGGIFVKPPRVYLSCGGEPPREILASQTGEGGPLSARYFTYVRSQSFVIGPQQQCLALINTASSDNPNIGIFREGELGTRQVVAVLLKGGFTATLLIIGLILAIVSYLTSRPLGVLIGITYSLTMIQNEASLFTTTLVPDPLAAREMWENITLMTVFAMLNVFLFGFRKVLRLENGITRTAIALVAIIPLIAIARQSNSTPDIIWAFYLALFLFAVTVALRFDIAPRLRLAAGGVLLASAIGAVLVEPYYLGRDLSDLTIEWFRDAFRLIAGLGMLLLLLVDVLQTRRERARMVAERIESLETQAETDRRLLETEREYARAREAATRTKAQLAAASHDIRQPIVGLRAAVASEAERLSPGLRDRLGQAIDYLETLTREYSNKEAGSENGAGGPVTGDAVEPYPLHLITRAVENMFSGEASQAGMRLDIRGSDDLTKVPALALIRATSNLVANALRHSSASSIEVRVDKTDAGTRLVVRDNGIGMDAATLAQVQEAGAKSDISEGDGLGLAIVHELAARHGFDFTLHSTPGEGTVAALTLP